MRDPIERFRVLPLGFRTAQCADCDVAVGR
jgi:hypothetical protein